VRVPGAFEQATEGVRALAPGRDRGSPAEVATVVTRDNRAALIALAETVRGLGVQRWRLLLPWAALDLAELDATADAVEAALDHARGLGLMAGLDRALSYHYALEMPEGER